MSVFLENRPRAGKRREPIADHLGRLARHSLFRQARLSGPRLSTFRAVSHVGPARPTTCNYAQPAAADVDIVAPGWRERLAGMDGEEQQMGINKDQAQGHIEEAKGAIKEATGKVVGNSSLEVKGNVEKNLGKVQAKVGDIREEMAKAPK